jgi:signal transduction histidine kinase
VCALSFETGQAQVYEGPEQVHAISETMSRRERQRFSEAIIGMRQPLSATCIPLIAGRKRVGTLLLENRTHAGAFGREELSFLSAVANLVALAVENANLREELQAVRALEEANRLKAELISTLAHEMRTPLTSIKGYSTALLMEETSFDSRTQNEFLTIIDEECDVLTDLIHDMLESSIIDAGLLKLELQPVRVQRLAQQAIADIGRHTTVHHFVSDFPDDFPIVDADANRISQVLRNLLDNAVKYSPQGGLVVVRGEVLTDEVLVAVADQGVGIAPEDLNRLFEKFFRVKSGLGDRVIGSGLGLPISRTIVVSHGGRIWAESQVGQGTTLFFTLPTRGTRGSRPGDGRKMRER